MIKDMAREMADVRTGLYVRACAYAETPPLSQAANEAWNLLLEACDNDALASALVHEAYQRGNCHPARRRKRR